MKSTARFLTTPDGPTIAVVELGGWDTHANQGSIRGDWLSNVDAITPQKDDDIGSQHHQMIAPPQGIAVF